MEHESTSKVLSAWNCCHFFFPWRQLSIGKCWQVLFLPRRAQTCSNCLHVFPSFSCTWNVALLLCIACKYQIQHCSTRISVQTPVRNHFNCCAKVASFRSSNGFYFVSFELIVFFLNILDVQLCFICCCWNHRQIVQIHCRQRKVKWFRFKLHSAVIDFTNFDRFVQKLCPLG